LHSSWFANIELRFFYHLPKYIFMPYTYEYPRPALTVDSILFRYSDNWEVLLIERAHEPFAGMWAFPGGFMDIDETAEEAVLRELKEETNLSGIELRQFYTASKVDRDPRHRTVSVIFYGFCDVRAQAVAGDDAKNVKWFPISELPPLAFDHGDILQKAITALQSVLERFSKQ
jgi:8-oxo-dGTP diphosphatase